MVQCAFFNLLVFTRARLRFAVPTARATWNGGGTFMSNRITIGIGDRVFAARSQTTPPSMPSKLLPLSIT
jgi:hypothetical protein